MPLTLPARPAAPKPAPPKVVALRPAAAAPAAVKEKKPRAPIPDNDYRKMRKYTTEKLLPFLEAKELQGIRLAINSNYEGDLTATELVLYLQTLESQKVSAKPSDGKPKKRGRPSNAEKAAKAATVKPATNPSAVLKAAASGQLLKPKPAAAPKPVAAVKAPVRLALPKRA